MASKEAVTKRTKRADRDPHSGRFVPGNPGGPGNPYAASSSNCGANAW